MPDTWGTPMGDFPSDNCDPYTFFSDNFAIFDTTFCGDWSGNSTSFLVVFERHLSPLVSLERSPDA